MPADTHPRYRTKRVAFRGTDGRVTSYLRVPDKTDPAYQALAPMGGRPL